jgi:hypothetical protein
LHVRDDLESRQTIGACLNDESVWLMLNDTPNNEIAHGRPKTFHQRDEREVLHTSLL